MTSFQEYREQLLGILLGLASRPAGGPDQVAPEAAAKPAPEPGAGAPTGLVPGISFTRPPKPEMGDLALPAFPIAKRLGQPPPVVAARWAEAVRAELGLPDGMLASLPVPVTRVLAAGPYVNVTLDPAALARLVTAAVAERGALYGHAPLPTGQAVMVEYSSPNTNKPLHLGHVRNNLLGMAVSNVLEAAGDRVVRTSLINDRGIHICKSMLAYQRWGEGPTGRETPASTGEKGDHFVGRYYVSFNTRQKAEREGYAHAQGVDLARFSKEALKGISDAEERKAREAEAEQFEDSFLESSELQAAVGEMLRRWESGDPEVLALWRTMNGWVYEGFRATYARLGCRFDRWYFESETWQAGKAEIERGLASGVFYRSADGSTWARLEPLGLQDKVLLRADGTAVYITQDIGTAIRKFEDYRMDRSLYVVGAEQEVHFRNLFAILRLLGHNWADRCRHLSYSLVNLPRGMGKLKSREGTAVDADDLLDDLHEMARAKIVEAGYAESPEMIEATAEQIGQGALKLYVLQVSPEKTIVFDPEQTIAFTGDTGPAVQYSHARIHGIVRKGQAAGKLGEEDFAEPRATPASTGSAGPQGIDPAGAQTDGADAPAAAPAGAPSPSSAPSGTGRSGVASVRFLRLDRADAGLLTEPEEREVLRLLAEFPDIVLAAARQLSPAPVANALLELTKAYARMYHQHEVLKADGPLMRARVQLALCTAQVLQNGLRLLTIEAPERM